MRGRFVVKLPAVLAVPVIVLVPSVMVIALPAATFRLQVVGRYGIFNLRRVQVGDDAGDDKGLLEVFVGIRPGEAKGGSDCSHEGFTFCHRCAVREEAPVLLAVGAIFHAGGL